MSFADAAQPCRDLFAVASIDMWEEYGEERLILLGICGGAVLYIACTERGGNLRIISARKASK